MQITEADARKVLEVIDAGLCEGVGVAEPGKMCVEAAVCYGLGLPFGDDPVCVSRALRSLKIRLNDSAWSSDKARAKGLRRLGLAQLGSRDAINDTEFVKRAAEMTIRKMVPGALRAAASIQKNAEHRDKLLTAANRCEIEGSRQSALDAKAAALAAYTAYTAAAADAALAARAAADAALAATYAADAKNSCAEARDKTLSDFAEAVVQILIEMKAPGCQWLALTEAA